MSQSRSILPPKTSPWTIGSAVILLIGVLLLAVSYWGGFPKLLYGGLSLVLCGVAIALVSVLLARSIGPSSRQHHV